MSTDVWGHILDGRAPTARRVDDLVASRSVVLGDDGAAEARRRLRSDVLGAGPLEPLLRLAGVTDVLVNGVDGVWIDRGEGLERVACDVGDAAAVRRLAVRLAGLAERRLDDASPYVDGLLPGGVRLHALLPPLVEGAAHVSLRIPRAVATGLAALGEAGSFPAAWLPVLRALVTSRVSFCVSGGTGSGKTTLLAALLGQVPEHERVVLVEDVRELAVGHPHVVRMQSRPANVEGRGGIDMVDLVRQSLRMRPDRLVVGEVRGAEVREMLTALNTGHEGGCGTIHANASADVVARFEALGALAGMSPAATRAQLTSAVRVVVHVRRRGRLRFVESIAVLVAAGDGIRVEPALVRADPDALDADESASTGMPGSHPDGWSLLAGLLGLRPPAPRADVPWAR